ncbi:response regulator [Tropicimonas isoalkanivorans]|uniref:Response regulator receiver domain-containing protein n=1 Tax=Tropicimonas isoalkanivorans TaxID=441112 RepID=A0A1I1NU50_9RHOB|nr:response regulator [Tropicimonas isoalkanivorans]SFC97270.1 Response regulator receiver domain-containing protein [Tropicimonas isoalkanivorans]
MKIMICEDNIVIAMSIEMLLEDSGFESAGIVTTRTACLQECDANRPDMVLVDLDLADGPTGVALVRDLHARGIPSIIVSGQTSVIDLSGSPAVAVLEKPFHDAALIALLEQSLPA